MAIILSGTGNTSFPSNLSTADDFQSRQGRVGSSGIGPGSDDWLYVSDGGGNTVYLGTFSSGHYVWGSGSRPLDFYTAATKRLSIDGSTGSMSRVIPGGSTLYPDFCARAWVNFNGTGSVAIRGAGNVTSITDNGVGDYTINFTTAMPDRNYSMVGTTDRSTTAETGYLHIYELSGTTPTTTACRIRCGQGSYTAFDGLNVSVAFFR